MFYLRVILLIQIIKFKGDIEFFLKGTFWLHFFIAV